MQHGKTKSTKISRVERLKLSNFLQGTLHHAQLSQTNPASWLNLAFVFKK
jgi:hypothetical protein